MLPGQPADSLHAVPQGENCPTSQGKDSGETALPGIEARVRHHSVSGEEVDRGVNRANDLQVEGFDISCLSSVLSEKSLNIIKK